jgi:hypothetical protein
MSVGVTKDYKLKVRILHASHTLGWTDIGLILYIIYYSDCDTFFFPLSFQQ